MTQVFIGQMPILLPTNSNKSTKRNANAIFIMNIVEKVSNVLQASAFE